IKLLRVTVPRIKLSLSSSSNDHTGSYATVLVGGGGGVATVAGGAGKGLNMNESISRRNDTPLQGTATTAAAAREEGGEEEGVTIRAVLLQLSDTAVFIFNLAFFAVMEAAAAP
ncbi:hypothetical protein BDFG_01674, partial [Blastomyces dermatitidis ATCC 26199]